MIVEQKGNLVGNTEVDSYHCSALASSELLILSSRCNREGAIIHYGLQTINLSRLEHILESLMFPLFQLRTVVWKRISGLLDVVKATTMSSFSRY